MPQKDIDVYTDISICPRCTGVGIVISGLTPEVARYGTCLPAGMSPAEAETAALLDAVRLLSAVIPAAYGGEIRFHTDCETTIRALFDLGRMRSQVVKNLVKEVLKCLSELKEKTGSHACVRFIMSRHNPAHDLSREARKKWNDLLSCKAKEY